MWLIPVLLLAACVAFPGNAGGFFDSSQCRADCSFRFNIERDFAGNVLLPFDSLRRIGYLKCLEECDAKEFPSDQDQER
jgi:hypothetical protein